MVLIRDEMEEDFAQVRAVNELAFGRSNEADLVDALRQKARPFISLVAVVGDKIIGHICFSPVSIESEQKTFTAMALAPMAVLPSCQRSGIGSLLVRRGLEACEALGHDVVVVLGHPTYYPRFGFTPARAKGLHSEYDVPDEAFMVAELKPSALGGRFGLVKYHSAFSGAD